MATEYNNISQDLLWELTRKNNSFLVKRTQAGGVQFSRDPFNLVNKHSRKHAGYLNDKAISITPDGNTVSVTTKKTAHSARPAQSQHSASYSASTPTRKLYRSVVNSTAKKGYRADLRSAAVARASALRQTQRDNKKEHERKPRGAKARKAEKA